VQVDAHIGTCVELALDLRLSTVILNTILKSHEEIEGSYIQCGPFFKPPKSLKHLPREKLESAIAALLMVVINCLLL
jgi:hypothetical protein